MLGPGIPMRAFAAAKKPERAPASVVRRALPWQPPAPVRSRVRGILDAARGGDSDRARFSQEPVRDLRRQAVEEEEEGLAKAGRTEGQAPAVSSDLEARIRRLSGGRPLTDSARSFFEPRFDQDFGGVRVHSGPAAARLASVLDARAFTVGRDIVFGEGEYAPRSQAGRRLLAHELTHVVQQGGASPGAQGARAPQSVGQEGERVRRLAITPVGSLHSGECGERRIAWRFTLDNPASADGYFVQQVNLHKDQQDCPSDVRSTPARPTFSFWEAWNVASGDTTEHIGSPGFTDRSAYPPQRTASGSYAAVGHVKFFLRSVTGDLGGFDTAPADPTSPWRPGRSGGVRLSGGLPSVGSEPSWWSNTPTEGPVMRWATSWWNCCGDASSNFSRVDANPK